MEVNNYPNLSEQEREVVQKLEEDLKYAYQKKDFDLVAKLKLEISDITGVLEF